MEGRARWVGSITPEGADTLRRLTASAAAELGLAATILIWGLNFAVIKVPLETIPPFTVNMLRYGVSVVVLGIVYVAWCRTRGVSTLADLKAAPAQVIGLGLLSNVGYQAGFITGIDLTTAGAAALLIATSPLWTAVIAHVLGIDRLRGKAWVGLAVSLGGAALVVLGRAEASLGGEDLGIALMLAAAAAWGLFTVLSRPVLDGGVSPMGLTVWGQTLAVPGLVALGWPGVRATDWSSVGTPEALAVVYSGGLSIGVAYVLWNQSVRVAGPSRTAAYSNLVPFIGLIAGVVFLGEPLQALQVAGGVCIVAGLVVLRRWR